MPGIRDLKDRVVLVTGAGSGIGRATAKAFGAAGSKVVVTDINAASAESCVEEIRAAGGEAEWHCVDTADKEAVFANADELWESYGHVDVVYNNAGIGIGGKTFAASDEDWERIVGINWWGVANGVRAHAPRMVQRGEGHIVNTSSTAGFVPIPGIAAYTATKHAVLGLGQALRSELRPYGVGVSTICPGIIKTNIMEEGVMYDSEQATAEQSRELMARWGRPPEQVAKAVLRAVRRNKAIVPVGIEAWFGWYLFRLSPTLGEWLIQRPIGNRLQ